MNSIPLSIRTIYLYSSQSLGISPRGDPAMVPRLRRMIEEGSPVPIGRVIICRAVSANVSSIVGKWPFVVLGMTQEDMRYYLRRMNAGAIEGRLPDPAMPEALISEPVAKNLKLRIGAVLLQPDVQERYSPFPVKVVGIAKTSDWLMLGDIDYQRLNHFPAVDNLLVFAADPRQQEDFDRWAVDRLKGERAHVFAYHKLEKETSEMFGILYKVLNVVIGTLVLVITIMMAMLMNIYQSQRLVEFGLLQAIGYTRRWLVGRVLRETTIVLLGGWVIGVFMAILLLWGVKATLMDPNAFALDPLDPVAYAYTIPVPIAVLLAATMTVFLRFKRFDPVAVVERRLV